MNRLSIHTLYHSLETEAFKELILPVHPTQEAPKEPSELRSYPTTWHLGCKTLEAIRMKMANVVTGYWSQ